MSNCQLACPAYHELMPGCCAQAKSLGAEFLTVSIEESGEGTG